MARVNQPQQSIPRSILTVSQELFVLLQETAFIINQLRRRTGGGTDVIKLTTIEATGDVTQKTADDIIYCTGNLEVTLIDMAIAKKSVTIRNISGTTTLIASVGTTESGTLTTGQSVTLGPRSSGWFII